MDILDYLSLSEEVISASRRHGGIQRCDAAVDAISKSLNSDAVFLVCGNGGSASDAMHIAGELVGRFLKERQALNCICLSSNPSILTAWSNDYSYDTVFSRQVEAYGKSGGTLLGLSTSGNSQNIINAFEAAKDIGMTTIGLTGEGGGKMRDHTDILIDVPSKSTPLIQQVHICLYHYICENVERSILAKRQ